MDYKQDFVLNNHCYLLSHSVGRPLKTAEHIAHQQFFQPWQYSNADPWAQWLCVITQFQTALAQLFNAHPDDFCPQVNLSSALCKIITAIPSFNTPTPTILMAEDDFPSMAFALEHSRNHQLNLRFIPKGSNLTDIACWQRYLTYEVDLVFISHAYSNTGQCSPVQDIIALTQQFNCISVVDCAQSAGVIPLDLKALNADFVIGSSVKWLCGGPGAAFLWVNPLRVSHCTPQDVGWFSHRNPFEFDIHHFEYHNTALRFWGGTPSILPYAIAAQSIAYFAAIGVQQVRQHNVALLDKIHAALPSWCVSPQQPEFASGTCILDFQHQQLNVLEKLQHHNISVDVRASGIRLSPHIYTDMNDIERLITAIEEALQ
ncbi:aminotransferase class V-fold PLP-dependent enzyme [Pseudoalteromonas ulvae]|uniref:Class V aminotransferase n=1 Tax=Pseudoalteromonas ulvae TaxID=107327 RepID=A0A2D0A0V8_PSEDV|nr:aminotransferase class V-fold PLP-dependent enzyme [Pseudoalteromonas ulvae]OUL56163.1 class V aminotransferase [Pseudoalteromonas ulvae]